MGAIQPKHAPEKTTEKANAWVDDHDRYCCVECSYHFSLLNRRHHCRACGDLYCGDCSAFTVSLKSRGYPAHARVRVCVGCFVFESGTSQVAETVRAYSGRETGPLSDTLSDMARGPHRLHFRGGAYKLTTSSSPITLFRVAGLSAVDKATFWSVTPATQALPQDTTTTDITQSNVLVVPNGVMMFEGYTVPDYVDTNADRRRHSGWQIFIPPAVSTELLHWQNAVRAKNDDKAEKHLRQAFLVQRQFFNRAREGGSGSGGGPASPRPTSPSGGSRRGSRSTKSRKGSGSQPEKTKTASGSSESNSSALTGVLSGTPAGPSSSSLSSSRPASPRPASPAQPAPPRPSSPVVVSRTTMPAHSF